MFTGIVTDIGVIEGVDGGRFIVRSKYDPETIALGASIACDGCCLTVVTVEAEADGGSRFGVDVSNETLACTTLGQWVNGTRINLERALTLGTELGGHIVTGHVDAVAAIQDRSSDGDSQRFVISIPDGLAGFIAAKGSVTLNGTSLTVNDVGPGAFGINLVPHTLEVTTWGEKRSGGQVNLEVDLLARYVARLNEAQ